MDLLLKIQLLLLGEGLGLVNPAARSTRLFSDGWWAMMAKGKNNTDFDD